jgi:hypothetical protein
MFIEHFGKRSGLAIHPWKYGHARRSRMAYLGHALAESLKAIILGQPERLIPAYVALRQAGKSAAQEPTFNGVTYELGSGGMVGVSFELTSGYNIGIWLREADWHAVATRVKDWTKEGYLACEDRGDPDLDPRPAQPKQV